MKKVSKLALAFVAMASFLCFLFYKSRYDKLYSVLEVLEFFGENNANNGNPNQFRTWRVFQAPAWQRVTDKAFAYSGHCTRQPGSNDVCPAVTVLAISPLERNDLQRMACKLWYDSSIQPISVPVTVADGGPPQAGTSNGTWRPYLFTCESKFAAVMPFGVSLGWREGVKEEEAYLHIDAPSLEEANTKSILACLSPQNQRIDSTFQALENVLLHRFFGVNHFLIYDGGLTNKFIEAFNLPDPEIASLNLAVLPWNIPVALTEAVIQFLVEYDCHFRAKSRRFPTHFVVNLEQILVPKSGARSLQEALAQSQKKGQLLVDILKFCKEYPEEEKSKHQRLIVALQQSVYNNDLSSGLKVKLSHGSGSGEQHHLQKDDIAVHDYGECHNFDMDVNGPESIRDRTVTRQAFEIEERIGKFFPPTET